MSTRFYALALFPMLLAHAGSGKTTVPDRFVGQWAGRAESCGSDADDLMLRIAPGHITYWESDGPIKAVVVRGDAEIALIVELSGEGETWLSTAQFTLSPDGMQLADTVTMPGKTLVRYKCPDAVRTPPERVSEPRLLREPAKVRH
uniref:hypothetical protein n=1 Tax=Xanthomonas sp. 0924 TaxID=2835534 RepID=UPI003F7EB286